MVRLVIHCKSKNSCSPKQPVDGELENCLNTFTPLSDPCSSRLHDTWCFQCSCLQFLSHHHLLFLRFCWSTQLWMHTKFWLPLQMYCLSMERLQSFFSSKCGYFDFFPQKNPLHWIFLLAPQCGKFCQKELNRNTAQESRGVFLI